MHDFTRLDDAILTTLRNGLADLRRRDETLALVACGMVDDLTGFFIAGAGAGWIAGLTGSDSDKAEWAWSPSEWPLSAEDSTDAAPGRVTSAIWALSGTQAMLDGTGDELEDDEYDELRSAYEGRIIAAIQRLQADGNVVDAHGRPVWVWLHSADASDEELDDRSFAMLQPAAISAAFADRYGAGTEALLARIASRTA